MNKALPSICVASCIAAGLACAAGAQLRLPPFVERQLPNGVVVYIMNRPGVPLVDIAVGIRGGKESEPPTLPGIASITADLLRKGTVRYSADQFSTALDALGGTYQSRASEDMTLLSAEFLAKDLPAALALLSESVLHPTFPDKEVVKLLGQRRDDVKSLKDNPRMAISPYAHQYFFGTRHPYGRIVDEESASRITRSAIAEYYGRLYNGRNLVIAVVGDVQPEAVLTQVQQSFGAAPLGDAFTWPDTKPLSAAGRNRLLLVDKPGATQTYFYIAQPGIAADNPDRFALKLVNTLFGGRFTSLLNEELRVKTGLTYGASNRIEENRLTGMNAIVTFTKTESTAQALDLALSTMKQFAANGITAEQLSSAKAYVEGTLPRETLETGDQLARELIRLNILGLGPGEVNQLFQRLDAVTLDDANRVIRRYYSAAALHFVLVGDAAKIRDQLKPLAPRIDEVSIAQPGFGPAVDH